MSSLDAMDTTGSADLYTFRTPGGASYTLPREAVSFSPVLDLLVDFKPDQREFDLKRDLNIEPSSTAPDGTKTPAHSLYGVSEEFYKLMFNFFNLLHQTHGWIPKMPESERLDQLKEREDKGEDVSAERAEIEQDLREGLAVGKYNPYDNQIAIFDADHPNILDQRYWGLVKNYTIEELASFYAEPTPPVLYIGNYALSKTIEVAMAFWYQKYKEELEDGTASAEITAKARLLQHIIDRDREKQEVERRREEAKENAEEEAKEAEQ